MLVCDCHCHRSLYQAKLMLMNSARDLMYCINRFAVKTLKSFLSFPQLLSIQTVYHPRSIHSSLSASLIPCNQSSTFNLNNYNPEPFITNTPRTRTERLVSGDRLLVDRLGLGGSSTGGDLVSVHSRHPWLGYLDGEPACCHQTCCVQMGPGSDSVILTLREHTLSSSSVPYFISSASYPMTNTSNLTFPSSLQNLLTKTTSPLFFVL